MKKNIIINLIIVLVITSIIICCAVGVSFFSKRLSVLDPKKNYGLNMKKWNYDEENNIYYQMGVKYCKNSINEKNEVFEIYVPGEYFIGEKNEDGTYKCTINEKGSKSIFIVENAPTIISIESNEENEQKPHEEYNPEYFSKYTDAGYIYIWPAFRGIEEGKTSSSNEEYNKAIINGIVDLKAFVKFFRYNSDLLPGSKEKIFVYGHKAGGTKSMILGVSGNNTSFSTDLKSIGAIMEDDDEEGTLDWVNGVMCCSPIKGINTLKESYSWLIEQYFEEKNDKISNLNIQHANNINSFKLKTEEGTLLFLADITNEKIYRNGLYYEYVLKEIEEYINFFIKSTSFPYKSNKTGITYKTAKEYVNELNSKTNWLKYDEKTNTIKIDSIENFANYYKEKREIIEKEDDNFQINPYYYLTSRYGGKGTSAVARYWNIYSILDDKCSNILTEINMKLLLQKYDDVRKVNFNYVWSKDYSDEEIEKMEFDNLKQWVRKCY